MANFEEYKARILSYTEGKDPLSIQRETPHVLPRLIQGVSESKLRERPEPNKWAIVEIIAHLADAEIVSTWRYRQMLEHDGTPLAPYDQDLWERYGDYGKRDLNDALNLFLLLRQANLQLFDRLTPEEWERHGMHAERGRMSVRDLVRQIAGHDLNHIEQIEKILGKQKSQTGAA